MFNIYLNKSNTKSAVYFGYLCSAKPRWRRSELKRYNSRHTNPHTTVGTLLALNPRQPAAFNQLSHNEEKSQNSQNLIN